MFGLVPALYYSALEEFLWKVTPCSVLDKYQCRTNSAQTDQRFLHNTGVQNCMYFENITLQSLNWMFDCTDILYLHVSHVCLADNTFQPLYPYSSIKRI